MQCLYKPQQMAMKRKLMNLPPWLEGWVVFVCMWGVCRILCVGSMVFERVENMKCLVHNLICTKLVVNTVFRGCCPSVSTHQLHRDSILLKNKASKMTSGFSC